MNISPQRMQHGFTSKRLAVWLGLIALLPLLIANVSTAQVELSDAEKARREKNAQFDKQNLRQKDTFVVEQSDAFIQRPEGEISGEFTIATTAPTVKFQILPDMEPEYFSEDAYQAGWANWARVRRSDDNHFYFAASDHLGRGAQINLYVYRPEDDVMERALDLSEALGWHDDMYTDGKLHGHVGIMPDGTMWGATHRGPTPTDEWWESGYRGSWLFSYNIHTGEFKNYGVPLIGNELPEFTVDTKRGILAGTGGLAPTMLSWDINEKRVRYAGSPPNGWVWHTRSMFLDEETGHFWGMDTSEQPYRFMAFDPEFNRFKRYDVEVPGHPETGAQAILRGNTEHPAADGWYYWATSNGTLFRFKPNWENGPEVEVIGTTWDKGRDVLQIALSPEGRYLYYQPKGENSPLVQYDVTTGQKKAIAFLQDHFFETYGYWPSSQVYGMEISEDGSFVVIVENGTFAGRGAAFGHPALTVVEIPESERQE